MTTVTERRSTTGVVELRADGGTDGTIGKVGGLAIVYNRYSQNLGGFVELVEPGFVDRTINTPGADVLARYQHDSDMLLGRTIADTLRLASDEARGLDYEADVPDTSYGRDLLTLVRRGDVRHSSFAFRTMTGGDRWDMTEDGTPLRILVRGGGKLVDVAPVVTPAYLDSTSGLRSLAEQRGLDLDTVVKAAAHNELGELLRSKAPTHIDLGSTSSGDGDAVDERDEDNGTAGPGPTHPALAVRRRRLELLERRDTPC